MKRLLLPVLVAAAATCACSKQQTQSYYDKQQTQIENFVKSAGGVKTVYKDHSVRVILQEGTTADTLSANGVVSFYYGGYTLTSGTSLSAGNLFATNKEDLVPAWQLTDDDFTITTVKLDEQPLLDGLREGLEGVRGGEECYILFLGKYGYGNKVSGTIPAKATLAYHVWVESISNE